MDCWDGSGEFGIMVIMYKRRGRAWLRGPFWKAADGTLSILASILGTCCRVSFVLVVPVYLGI
jgi:hypothetical protein